MLLALGGFFGWLLYHHFTDYDLSALMKNPKLALAMSSSPPSPPLQRIHHVFVIVEENHNWQDIYHNPEAPFINQTLLSQGGFAQNYHNISPQLGNLHPSEPNYIQLEAGKVAFPDHTFTSDHLPDAANSTSSHDHLTYLLDQNHLSWNSYQADISGSDCPQSDQGNYAAKHNPFVFFQDITADSAYCIAHIRPVTELTGPNFANYTFITPDLQHDMHDGTIKQADDWLAKTVPLITNSAAFKTDGVLFITWDEGNGDADENNPIGMIILSPLAKQNYSNIIAYSHASLVKTVQKIFNLSPLLGFAADPKTNDLSDFFQ